MKKYLRISIMQVKLMAFYYTVCTQLPILRLESLDFIGINLSASYSFVSERENIIKYILSFILSIYFNFRLKYLASNQGIFSSEMTFFIQWCRNRGGQGGHCPPPIFGRSVNPILTRESRFSHLLLLAPPMFFTIRHHWVDIYY